MKIKNVTQVAYVKNVVMMIIDFNINVDFFTLKQHGRQSNTISCFAPLSPEWPLDILIILK